MDKNDKVFAQLQRTIADYAAKTKKAPEKIIVEKGRQLLFGSHNKFGNFEGLFGEFSKMKPRKGEILAASKSLFSAGKGVKTSPISRKVAADILGGNSAGVFAAGKFATAATRPKLVRQINKGRKIGRHTTNNLKKSAPLLGNQRILGLVAHRSDGEVVLNKQNLAAAVEVAKREHARGYSAAAFLPKRYRRTIERLAGREYKNGQLKGVSSVDAVVMHKHVKEIVPNRNGAISNIEGDVSPRGAWLKISAFTTNVGKAGFKRIVSKVMSKLNADMRAYLAGKLRAK